MTLPLPRWRETWRVLAYTLAIALAFVALGRLQLALFGSPVTQQLLQRWGWLDTDPAARWREQALAVAEASRIAATRLPASHRLDLVRLGHALGYASQQAGAYALSPPAARDAARARAEPHAALARELADAYGLGDAQPLPATNLREFTELPERYDADENGLAARIESRLSPLHRHLYLLGTLIGGEAARIDDTGGRFSLPPASRIVRHATLAGIEPMLWQPLAAAPQPDETPEQVVQRYRAALEALARALQRASPAPAR
jgi:hypothetical protein